MRLYRLAMLSIGFAGAFALSSCKNDEITNPAIPPLTQLRFINGVPDTLAVDIRMIDQIEWSAFANNLNFRAGTEFFPTEAKSRRIRVFPTSRNLDVTSQILLDTEVTLAANTRVTLLLTGSARAKTLKFVMITDETAAPPAGQIGVRLVNASTGSVSGYLVNAPADALPGSATFASVAALGQSAYANKATGAAALRVTDVGSATVNASAAGPATPAAVTGAFPAAGVSSAGTLFSAYYFPRGVAGSPQNAVTAPSIIWFVDRNPCDAGC